MICKENGEQFVKFILFFWGAFVTIYRIHINGTKGREKWGTVLVRKRWYFTFICEIAMMEMWFVQQQEVERMLKPEELDISPLFQGINYEEYCRMLTCFRAVQKSFHADEVVYDFSASRNNAVGIIEHGTATLIRIDESGVTTVLEELKTGGVFGRTLAFDASGEDSLEIVSRTHCDVLFIDYAHILKRCENACTHHSILVQNMLQLIANKAQTLSERVDVLSRRTIREKLLCYFRQLAEKSNGATFTIPFSLSTMADYIATDRSAMMRELKRLREEGIVCSEGRIFTLLE